MSNKKKGNPENNFFKFLQDLKTETQKSLNSLLIETNELNNNIFKDGKERTFHII